MRVFRVSRIRGKVGYSSKAEHDFNRPEDFDPRIYATPHRLAARRDRRHARASGSRPRRLARRCATSAMPARSTREPTDGVGSFRDRVRRRAAADRRGCSGSASRPASWARRELVEEARERLELRDRAPHRAARELRRAGAPRARRRAPRPRTTTRPRVADPARALRPPRHARRHPDRGGARGLASSTCGELCETLQVTETELRQDIDVLNVVNFGGGSYVLYAEVSGRPDRGRPRALRRQLRPARAAAAARGEGARGRDRPDRRAPARGLARSPRARRSSTRSARTRPQEGLQITTAKGDDSEIARVVSEAIAARRLLEIELLQGERGRVHRAHGSSPTSSINGQEGWYVHCVGPRARTTPARSGSTASARPRCSTRASSRAPGSSPTSHGWPRTGEVAGVARRAHLDVARARPLGARGPAGGRGARGRRRDRRAALRRRTTGSRARSSRRPATPSCSSRRTPARRCSRPPRPLRRRRQALSLDPGLGRRLGTGLGVPAHVEFDMEGPVPALHGPDQVTLDEALGGPARRRNGCRCALETSTTAPVGSRYGRCPPGPDSIPRPLARWRDRAGCCASEPRRRPARYRDDRAEVARRLAEAVADRGKHSRALTSCWSTVPSASRSFSRANRLLART